MITIGQSNQRTYNASELDVAWKSLCEWFVPFDGVCVLVSGGVDSSLLLAAASTHKETRRISAVTADSPSIARSEFEQVKHFVASLGVSHLVLQTSELADPSYQANAGDRCYFCKKALYTALEDTLKVIESQGQGDIVVDGTNTDDLNDHRPSLPASREHGLRHPYIELGFGKSIIRELSRARGLLMWNKPAMACLASRVQDGVVVSQEKLEIVEKAEAALAAFGLETFRVRYHESGSGRFLQRIARIEVPSDKLSVLIADDVRRDVVEQLRALGFSHVTIDLEGYKRGGRVSA